MPVAVGSSTQVITVKATGTTASVAAWQLNNGAWVRVMGPWSGHVGRSGVVPASQRRQNTGTTPGGTFTMTEAFGIAGNPGTHLSYFTVGPDDWWVEDNNSAFYNQHRLGSQGGFNTSLPESDVNGSERLITHPTAYQQAVVINFNRSPAVPYHGAGIFLHVDTGRPTEGCVSIPRSGLEQLMRWLVPGAQPRIAIG